MAFDETLAARIRDALARKRGVEEKKMFGCICFFINGNAVAGVWKDRLIARLGSDVWVGGGAIICPGVKIGSKAVIGAGSVVTRDVPDGVFAAGNPCRVIREITE